MGAGLSGELRSQYPREQTEKVGEGGGGEEADAGDAHVARVPPPLPRPANVAPPHRAQARERERDSNGQWRDARG
jgi:hypothetical protein